MAMIKTVESQVVLEVQCASPTLRALVYRWRFRYCRILVREAGELDRADPTDYGGPRMPFEQFN